MKAAAVFPGTRTLRVVDDFPEPKLTSNTGVRLRILNVGVCGTDREIASFHYGTPPEGSEYLVIGHEALGEVLEVGREVTNLKPGDLAIPTVRRPCNHKECAPCRAGRADFCITGDYQERGILKRHGFMTEQVVDEASNMNAVPAALREVGVLVEPLTIAEKSLIEAMKVQNRLPWDTTAQTRRAVVLGAGPVGLLGAMALVTHGYDVTVYSRDREPSPAAEIVEAIGGKYISSQDRSADQLAADVGDIDLVYEASGSSQLAFGVLPALGPNGLFVLTGVPGPHPAVPLDTATLMRSMVLKNQCMLGTVNAGRDAFENAIADLQTFYARWPDSVRALITRRFPLESFSEPILQPQGIKNVVAIA